jgi:putative transposase
MPRPRRAIEPGGHYHVHTRGNNKRPIYIDERDRVGFLELFALLQQKYEWRVYAWALMTNHYHFVLQVPTGALSAGMCELNGRYARWSNRRHGRCDHVFGERFTSNEIRSDEYLVEACRYVVLNPVRAGVCRRPDEWKWSSYGASAGLRKPEPFLAHDALFDLFHAMFGTPKTKMFEAYERFVLSGLVQTRLFDHAVPGTG